MKAQFKCKAHDGKMIYSNSRHFEGHGIMTDHRAFCIEHEGKEFIGSFQEVGSIPEKQKLFNYLHGPIIDYTMRALTDEGWELMNEAKAYGYLIDELAFEVIRNKNGEEKRVPISMGSSDTPKSRLVKFVNDCILLLETRHDTRVPDSQEYKDMMEKKKNG